MTKDQALAALIILHSSDDPEAAHSEADRILCDLLAALGYADVVEAWREVPKWYA